jgi:hypothetical protein
MRHLILNLEATRPVHHCLYCLEVVKERIKKMLVTEKMSRKNYDESAIRRSMRITGYDEKKRM